MPCSTRCSSWDPFGACLDRSKNPFPLLYKRLHGPVGLFVSHIPFLDLFGFEDRREGIKGRGKGEMRSKRPYRPQNERG